MLVQTSEVKLHFEQRSGNKMPLHKTLHGVAFICPVFDGYFLHMLSFFRKVVYLFFAFLIMIMLICIYVYFALKHVL